MASTTLTNAANLHLYYEKKLLSVLEPRLVLQPLGKKQRLPKGNGKRVKWLRYSTINSSVVPLTEGTVPNEIAFTTATVQADIEQYGQYAKVSDLLSDTAIDPVMENLSERFGIAASKTIEELIISEISQNCANQNVNGRANFAAIGATPGVSDVLNHKELIEAMIRQKAELIGPHESGDYVCVLHAHAEYDLLSDTQAGSFLDIQKYTDNRPVLNGEIGRMYGMRFLVSDKMLNSLPAVHGGPSNVVQSFVIGEEAFGVVELNGDAMKMIMKKHGSAGAVDPLDQFATVGYKINGFAAKYLQSGSKRVIAVNSASSLT